MDRLAKLENLVELLKEIDAGYQLWKAFDEGHIEVETERWYGVVDPLLRELGIRT